jgi:hypothetical protein
MALEALELADPPNEQARCELLLAVGEAELRAGEVMSAKRAFLDAAGIARRLGLSLELARAAAGYGGRFMWARAAGDDRLVPLLEEGLAALREEDVELRARLLARLAGVLRDEHSRDRRDRMSRQAVELARRAGNPVALAYGMSLLAETSRLLGDSDSAAVLYRLLVPWAAFSAADHPEGFRGSVFRYLGLLAATTKSLDAAERHFEDGLAANAKMGARPWRAHTACDYARMLHARNGGGDRERARALLDEALDTYRELAMDTCAAAAAALAREAGTTA